MIIKNIRSSKLLKNSSIYVFANIINSAVPFFLIPVLTRYLTPYDYGMISMFLVVMAFITPFLGLGVHGAIAKKFYSNEKEDLPTYIGNCFFVLFSSLIIVSVSLCFLRNIFFQLTSIPTQFIGTIIFLSFTQFVTLVPLTLWQIKKKALFYGAFQISNTVINFTTTIILIVVYNKNWQGRIDAQVYTAIIFLVVSVFILFKKKEIRFIFKREYFIHAIKYGIPLIPHTLGGITISMVDRVFLTKLVGLDITGVYALALQLSNVIYILTNSFNNAYVPWLFEKLQLDDHESKIKIVKLTYFYFIVIFVIAILFALTAPIALPYLVGDKFGKASEFMIWLCLGFAFNGMYLMVTNYIFYTEKTSVLALLTISTGIVTIACNYILILNFGAIGAAISFTIGYALLFVMTWLLSQKVFPMPWFQFEKLWSR